jgi:hypothetical protein
MSGARSPSLHRFTQTIFALTKWPCGRRAIPALRELLFEREPSGLYQVRRSRGRGAGGAGRLRRADGFFACATRGDDPVERLGDEAITNAVALALARLREQQIFQLLLSVAKRRHLPGVIAALGSYHRAEAIPVLLDALAADDCRPAAETALKKLGRLTQPAL